MTDIPPRFPDPRNLIGRQFISGGTIFLAGDVDEPRLAATPDADELGLDPEEEEEDQVWYRLNRDTLLEMLDQLNMFREQDKA